MNNITLTHLTIVMLKQNSQAPAFLYYWGSHFKTTRQTDEIADYFRPFISRGWRCDLVMERFPENDGWLKALGDLGVNLHCLPRATGNFDFSAAFRIAAVCRAIRCTVFQCDNIATAPLIGAAAARVPVRIWYKRSMNSDYEEDRPPNLRNRLAVSTRLCCRLASRVVGISRTVGDELISLGLPASKLFIHNNPRPEWSGRLIGRNTARQQLGYTPTDLVILAVGRAEPVKAWDILVPAFIKVATAVPQARLLLVGSNNSAREQQFMQRLQPAILLHQFEGRVQFTGHVDDIKPYLAAADIFVMPSRSEGCSNALIEALGAGLPCIATDVGSAGELLGGHPAGLLVRRNDSDDLTTKLMEVSSNDGRRKVMAARAMVPDHVLSRQAHAERLAAYYDSLLPFQSENTYGADLENCIKKSTSGYSQDAHQ